jgi:predicted Zn finger-like uncharacterized protein
MSLATRCPTCATAFRVVQDQLKVSNGWVRCGRCGEVFNATDGLYDLDDGASPAPSDTAAPPGATLVRQARPDWPGPQQQTQTATAVMPPSPFPPHYAPTEPMGLDDRPPPAGTVFDDLATPPGAAASLPPDEEIEALIAANRNAVEPDSAPAADDFSLPAEPSELATDADLPTPGFVQQADRAARWRRPWVRALLSLVVLGLGALLLAQVAYVQRDLIAARLPALQPALAAMCREAGCRIEPLRRIEPLTVESSGLVRVEGSPLYRLSLVLRNRDDTALKLPALELSITDPSGELVARRVLSPAEAGAKDDTIGAGQEVAMQSLLSVAERRVAGYTIELFYP